MSETVFIVDDNGAVCDALAQVLEGAGLRIQVYESAASFLANSGPNLMGCAVWAVGSFRLFGLWERILGKLAREEPAARLRMNLSLLILFVEAGSAAECRPSPLTKAAIHPVHHTNVRKLGADSTGRGVEKLPLMALSTNKGR